MYKKKAIWTSQPELKDWIDNLREEYPGLSYDEYEQIMYDKNQDDFDLLREDLGITVSGQILVFAELGTWRGTKKGVKALNGHRISDCLSSFVSGMSESEWYIDERGDLVGVESHHDGVNRYLYREVKQTISQTSIRNLCDKYLKGKATRNDITRCTSSIGERIWKYYFA